MPARPYILAETTWQAVKDAAFEVVILPWGATEAHNYHLPYGTDNYQCDYVAAEAARLAWAQGVKVVVLPTIPFGVNTGQLDITLDMNLNPSTQLAILRDVVQVLARQGIPKLVVLNGHGGNDFRQILRELQAEFPSVFLSTATLFRIVDRSQFFEAPGDHADEMETSMMLHLAPELVLPLAEAGAGASKHSHPGLAQLGLGPARVEPGERRHGRGQPGRRHRCQRCGVSGGRDAGTEPVFGGAGGCQPARFIRVKLVFPVTGSADFVVRVLFIPGAGYNVRATFD